MPQELKPKTFVRVRTFNDTRYICYGHPIVIDKLDMPY